MYAIIQTGLKQYRVEKEDVIEVDLLDHKQEIVEFKKIVFLNDKKNMKIGAPYLENYLVKGLVIGEVKGPKVFAFKYKRRKNYHRKVGHRQKYAKVKIIDIISG